MITKFQWADGSLHDEAPSFRKVAICNGCGAIIEDEKGDVAFITYRNNISRRMLMIHTKPGCASGAIFYANEEDKNEVSD